MRSTRKAASLVALIKEHTHVEARIVVGRTGQFDVLVNAERIASRGGNVATRILFGAGFPDLDAVVEEVGKRLA